MNIILTQYKYGILFILFCLFSPCSLAQLSTDFIQQVKHNPTCLNLMPCPKKLTLASEFVELSAKPTIYIKGMSKERKKNALLRINQQLNRLKNTRFINFVEVDNSKKADVVLNISRPTQGPINYRVPQLGFDERYQLIITNKAISGNTSSDVSNTLINNQSPQDKKHKTALVRIEANTDFGALHGLTTFVQIITTSNKNKAFLLPVLTIEDEPRFKWRGLLVDSVRHFISIKALKRQLDGMAAAKLNVFHWHLTDDQGWRFESKRYPKLQLLASDHLFYTQKQITSLVDYASLLGIRVVPEFDVPGHASAIALAYPELITQKKNYKMERHWGVFEPLLDVSDPKVYQFVDEIVEELTGLFPDHYLHIGGDEVYPVQWQKSKKIKSLMKSEKLANSHDVQRYFNSKLEVILTKHQRLMMGWDEIYHKDLPRNIMVQSWRGLESLNKIASNDYQGLLSTGYYIDQPQYTRFHYLNDPQGNVLSDVEIKHYSHTITPATNEQWRSWQLTIPRLKGSAVKGEFTLIKRFENEKVARSGYLKLNNNHYKKVTLAPLDLTKQQEIPIVFFVDSWIGPLKFQLAINSKNADDNKVFIGNAYYPLQSREQLKKTDNELKKVITLMSPLSLKQAGNIQGGEATLWSEMVDENNIDLRTWPRLFAIAERFWSSKELVDVKSMYQRLSVIDTYSKNIIGLKHHQQQLDGFSALLSKAKIPKRFLTSLMTVSQAFEPAHYYTRHHLKHQQNNYHQQAPLNLFVDYLPVESIEVQSLERQINNFILGDDTALLPVKERLISWQKNVRILSEHIDEKENESDLSPLLARLKMFTELALKVTAQCTKERVLTPEQIEKTSIQLNSIQMKQYEEVLPSVSSFYDLLHHCKSNN